MEPRFERRLSLWASIGVSIANTALVTLFAFGVVIAISFVLHGGPGLASR